MGPCCSHSESGSRGLGSDGLREAALLLCGGGVSKNRNYAKRKRPRKMTPPPHCDASLGVGGVGVCCFSRGGTGSLVGIREATGIGLEMEGKIVPGSAVESFMRFGKSIGGVRSLDFVYTHGKNIG